MTVFGYLAMAPLVMLALALAVTYVLTTALWADWLLRRALQVPPRVGAAARPRLARLLPPTMRGGKS